MNTVRLESARFISTSGYVGYLPLAPGTWGTLLALVAYLLLPASPWSSAIAFAITFPLGVWAAGVGARDLWPGSKKKGDPGRVTIDEFAAFFVAVIFLPYGPAYGVLGFFFFRAFDILKPWPSRWCEKLPGGWGIMTDDFVAAVYANITLQLVHLAAVSLSFPLSVYFT